MSIKRITIKQLFFIKLILHIAALLPLTFNYFQAFTGQIGADPVEEILHFTGIGAFNLLLLSLLISPLAKYSRQGLLIRLRRPIGLYAFVYALFHFASYLMFDLQLEWALVLSELISRPYISVGVVAFVILSILAATSTKASQKRLGKSWQNIHNWIYLAGILVALHYLWGVKSGLAQPLFYALILTVLLVVRKDKFKRALRSRTPK